MSAAVIPTPLHNGGTTSAHWLKPDTPDAIRRDLDALVGEAKCPSGVHLAADDLGMGNPAHDPAPGEPQTARSIGMGPPWADFADAVDLASLDHARSRYLRRRAMDAVDQLIALLDALDAEDEDREPDQDGGEADDVDMEDDGTAEPSLGAPERHPDPPPPGYTTSWGPYADRSTNARQVGWAAGGSSDREVEDEHDEENGDRDDDGLSRGEADGSDDEPSLGAVEWSGAGDNWHRAGTDTSDVEAVNEDGDPGSEPWWDHPAHPSPDLASAR